jgi:hypothetical protein
VGLANLGVDARSHRAWAKRAIRPPPTPTRRAAAGGSPGHPCLRSRTALGQRRHGQSARRLPRRERLPHRGPTTGRAPRELLPPDEGDLVAAARTVMQACLPTGMIGDQHHRASLSGGPAARVERTPPTSRSGSPAGVGADDVRWPGAVRTLRHDLGPRHARPLDHRRLGRFAVGAHDGGGRGRARRPGMRGPRDPGRGPQGIDGSRRGRCAPNEWITGCPSRSIQGWRKP